MARRLTATGFLRTASDPTYPGYIEPNEIHQVLSDTMQIVSSTFLGLTLQCARCHAHKFDPISQRDYYGLQAVFLPALDPARWKPSGERGIPLATEKELARLRAHNQEVDERAKAIEVKLAALTEGRRRKRIDELVAGQPTEVRNTLSVALAQAARKTIGRAEGARVPAGSGRRPHRGRPGRTRSGVQEGSRGPQGRDRRRDGREEARAGARPGVE